MRVKKIEYVVATHMLLLSLVILIGSFVTPVQASVGATLAERLTSTTALQVYAALSFVAGAAHLAVLLQNLEWRNTVLLFEFMLFLFFTTVLILSGTIFSPLWPFTSALAFVCVFLRREWS